MPTPDRRLVDLHAHSSASSGAWGTPARAAAFFKEHGYAAYATTDHDSLEAQEPSERCAREQGLEYIRGVEFSVVPDDPRLRREIVHILAFYYEITPALRRLSRSNLDGSARGWREFLDRLAVKGIADITQERLREHIRHHFGADDLWKQPSDHGPMGDLLRADGVLPADGSRTIRDLREEIGPPLDWPDPAPLSEACKVLREAGAVLILAHPVQPGAPTDEAERRRLVYWLENYVDGLEIYTPKHPPAYRAMLLDLVRDMRRPFTGGSDRHQYAKPGEMSDAPYACLELLIEFRGRA